MQLAVRIFRAAGVIAPITAHNGIELAPGQSVGSTGLSERAQEPPGPRQYQRPLLVHAGVCGPARCSPASTWPADPDCRMLLRSGADTGAAGCQTGSGRQLNDALSFL